MQADSPVKKLALLLVVVLVINPPVKAQMPDKPFRHLCYHLDSLYRNNWNRPSLNGLNSILAPQAQFFHSETGPLAGRQAIESFLLDQAADSLVMHPRKQLILGSRLVYPLYRNGTLYGATISGEELIYYDQKGEPERAGGMEEYMQVWEKENGNWQLVQLLVYGHGPVPANPAKEPMLLPKEARNPYSKP